MEPPDAEGDSSRLLLHLSILALGRRERPGGVTHRPLQPVRFHIRVTPVCRRAGIRDQAQRQVRVVPREDRRRRQHALHVGHRRRAVRRPLPLGALLQQGVERSQHARQVRQQALVITDRAHQRPQLLHVLRVGRRSESLGLLLHRAESRLRQPPPEVHHFSHPELTFVLSETDPVALQALQSPVQPLQELLVIVTTDQHVVQVADNSWQPIQHLVHDGLKLRSAGADAVGQTVHPHSSAVSGHGCYLAALLVELALQVCVPAVQLAEDLSAHAGEQLLRSAHWVL